MDKQIGGRVRSLREGLGMTQTRLAELSGLSRPHVYMIETGKRTELAGSTYLALADALGVTVDYLMRGDDEAA